MNDDVIIDEVRRIREEFAARFGNDVRAMGNYLKTQQRKRKARVVSARRKKTRSIGQSRKPTRKPA